MSKPVTLELVFESEKDRESWVGWYLDGGGEQESEMYADDWDYDQNEQHVVRMKISGRR